MLGLLLTILPTLIGAWWISIHGFRPARLCDIGVVWLLLFFGWFFGTPVFIGWITGSISWITSVILGFALLFIGLICRNSDLRACYGYERIGFHSLLSRLRSLTFMEHTFLIFPFFIFFTLFLIGTLLPFRTYDAIGYHSHNPVGWVLISHFSLHHFGIPEAHPTGNVFITYANIKGIWPFLIMDYNRNMVGTATTQTAFILLLFSALVCIWRRFDFSLKWCGFACIFCLVSPEVLLQSLDLYSDLAYLSASVSLLSVLVILTQDAKFTLMKLLPACSGFLLITGLKPSGFLLAAGFGLVYLIALYNAEEISRFARLRNSVVGFLFVVFFSVATAGYWPIKSLLVYGNPFYPFGFQIGPYSFPGIPTAASPSDHSELYLNSSGISAWWQVVSEQVRTTDLGHWHNGLGAAFFVMGIPAIVA
ncbi:MAG: hypothetical protein SFY68_02880, partial [Candidatus Sumerlaeia bacterium]|nr:hypothetical protein [Candidatus Sumerlaeia bacterium]